MKIQRIIKSDLCISCGLCTNIPGTKMKMVKGVFIPFFQNILSNSDDQFLYDICPGKGYDIVADAKYLYNNMDDVSYDYKFGYFRKIAAAHCNDEEFLTKSSSGGMMPALAYYLLQEKMVDGVLTVKFKYTENGPVPEPFIAETKDDLIQAQGSKYMPVPLLQNLNEILEYPGQLAVIGTPCQIAGIRLYQKKDKRLLKIIKYTIANFCGGYRDFRETERIWDIYNIKKENIKYFSYRGDGQPGAMTVEQNDGNVDKIKYPDYSRLTGYIKYYRCRTCIDATGELADISFGDAWLPKYLKSGKKWSVFICRSEEMLSIISNMQEKNLMKSGNITIEELFDSQKGNIISKKERQLSRIRLLKLLGRRIPQFDRGYSTQNKNLLLEIKVLISHNLLYFLEKFSLYLFIAKILRRVEKNNYEIKG